MIWAAISLYGVSEPKIVSCRRNFELYCSTSQSTLMQFVADLFGEQATWSFQQEKTLRALQTLHDCGSLSTLFGLYRGLQTLLTLAYFKMSEDYWLDICTVEFASLTNWHCLRLFYERNGQKPNLASWNYMKAQNEAWRPSSTRKEVKICSSVEYI